MKTPDKIYLNADAATDLRYSPGEDDSKIEYIRKDALLEWAKDMKEANDGVCNTSYYQEFIDKLESM